MHSEFVLRPIRHRDLDSFYQLIMTAQVGMTSLPKDKTALVRKIEHSVNSFEKTVIYPGGELYLFVLEETKTKNLVGVSGIIASVGCDSPFYAFDQQTINTHSDCLNKHHQVDLLKMSVTRSGPTEIGSLYLHPDYRQRGLGRYLSLSRFLFMAEHSNRFKKTVIAEIRGWSDADGNSPFWDHVGRTFFDMSFEEADQLSGMNKQFIWDLMPKHPLYVSILPEAARAVIGKAHSNTVPAMSLLNSEGFQTTSSIDIFDAGPKLSCFLSDIRTVKQQKSQTNWQFSTVSNGESALVSKGRLQTFRVYLTTVCQADGQVHISGHMASQLVQEEKVRWVYLGGKSLAVSQKSGSFIQRFSTWYQELSTSLVENFTQD